MIKSAIHVRVVSGYSSLYSKVKDPQRFNEVSPGAGEVALRLKALCLLAEDLGLIFRTHMEAYNTL